MRGQARCLTKRRAAVSVALFLVALCTQPLGAQLTPGDHVRIHQREGCCEVTTSGTFASLTSDYLAVIAREEHISIARDSILSIERAAPGAGHGRQGALIGLVSGTFGGWLIGDAISKTVPDGDYSGLVKFEGTIITTAAGGLVGVLIGAIIGSNVHDEVWQRVQLPPRVSVQPHWGSDRRTLGIAVVARF